MADVDPGSPSPLGATLDDRGVNFSVYARGAERLELLLFRGDGDTVPSDVVVLDPGAHRNYHYWHVHVPGLKEGQRYAYRALGPSDPARGLRFDPRKVLIDPYGFGVGVPAGWNRNADATPPLKSVVVRTDDYDWEGDRPLARPFSSTVIYEAHLRAFTANPNSGVPEAERGRYAGMIRKIPYLKDLGVTAVELLPIFQFDELAAPAGRKNFWGYQPVSFFAPHTAYASRPDPIVAVKEFRDLVKALHRAGIEVYLDVVFNHTAEGGADGPTYHLKGLSNDTYYLLEADRARYADYTGCGNTLNANHPIVRRMIRDSLRYWVREMHVDGFRFDLASILSRDETGRPMKRAPVLYDLESDPELARTKLIAEAWDAAGLYEVGSFGGESWREWNGKFRDDLRRFLRAEEGMAGAAATRLLGSPDLYAHEDREAEQSINFVTCHDGFTLNDLVSYDRKHNEENGEGNRDGADDNASWNCGVEGPSSDPAIEALRNRQVKNFLAVTMLSIGAPMLLMGDEVRRTQRGNNNAYCHDDERTWFDWKDVSRHADILRFTRQLIAARLNRQDHGLKLNQWLQRASIEWHGRRLHEPDWSASSRSLSVTLGSTDSRRRLHLIIHPHWEPAEFPLPAPGEGGWHRLIDTTLPSPQDIQPASLAPRHHSPTYSVGARSVVALVSGSDFELP